jgi:hypothetical protein
LSPKAARKISLPSWEGSLGEVAPGVMKGICAFCTCGPMASTESESAKPTMPTTLSLSINWLATVEITVASLLES